MKIINQTIISLDQYLGAIYQNASEVMMMALSQDHKHIMAEDGTMVLANQDQLNYAMKIIDLYITQQEADRQYELKRHKCEHCNCMDCSMRGHCGQEDWSEKPVEHKHAWHADSDKRGADVCSGCMEWRWSESR